MKLRLSAIGFFILLCSTSYLSAQDSTRVTTDSVTSGALNIIVDCPSCDQDYFRTEITFVNFVRDRAVADVNILITRQTTGSLGVEHTLEFIGQKNFNGMRDTLTYVSQQSDSDDDIRHGLVTTIKLGLMRYVSRTKLSGDIRIAYEKPSVAKVIKDPWNYWVFTISADGSTGGQKSTSRFYMYNQLRARRATEKNRAELSAYWSYQENRYDYDDFKLTSVSRSRGAEIGMMWGIDDHWSWGLETGISTSTYSNVQNRWYSAGALEYNVFPYKVSTRRQLRLQYWLSENYYDFGELTIFDQYHAWLTRETISASLSFIQPWGSTSSSVSASHYFHDFDRNRLTIDSDLSFKLVRGLSLNCYGYITWVHDQVSLSAVGATQDEILLQRRQLATSYEYYVSFGVSYTFGSIYNTIVNPRFGN